MASSTTDSARRRRRSWFQISLRGLLTLTVIASLGMTGCYYYVLPFKRQQRAIASIRELGATVSVRPADGSQWLRRAVGEELFVEAELVYLPRLPQESMTVDDRVLAYCPQLVRLRRLKLAGSRITDEGLARIRHMESLETISLDATKITDTGLRHIANLPNLKRLSLRNTMVTDAGLQWLGNLTRLEYFSLKSPDVRGEGLSFLRNCKRLNSLQFVGDAASNEWLHHAGPPPTITWIELHSTSIDDTGVALLSVCKQLSQVHTSPQMP